MASAVKQTQLDFAFTPERAEGLMREVNRFYDRECEFIFVGNSSRTRLPLVMPHARAFIADSQTEFWGGNNDEWEALLGCAFSHYDRVDRGRMEWHARRQEKLEQRIKALSTELTAMRQLLVERQQRAAADRERLMQKLHAERETHGKVSEQHAALFAKHSALVEERRSDLERLAQKLLAQTEAHRKARQTIEARNAELTSMRQLLAERQQWAAADREHRKHLQAGAASVRVASRAAP